MTPVTCTIFASTALAALSVLATPRGASAQAPRRVSLAVRPNGPAVTEDGRIQGYETVDYRVRVQAGDSLRVRLTTDQRSSYMNVLPPDADTAIFVGSRSGGEFAARLPGTGDYTVRVYLMRNAARRGATASYRLSASLARPTPTLPGRPTPGAVAMGGVFDTSVSSQGVTFQVRTRPEAMGIRLTITPRGLSDDSSPTTRLIAGPVRGVAVSDIDMNRSPEIWVFVRTGDPRHPQQVVGFATNRRRSMSEISIPGEPETDAGRAGYRGRDEFGVVDNKFVRSFPLFGPADRPTGRRRQIEYRLVPGEANWQLRTQRITEF